MGHAWRAEKEQGKKRGSCRKASQTILIPYLEIRKNLHRILDLFRWHSQDCTLTLTHTMGFI